MDEEMKLHSIKDWANTTPLLIQNPITSRELFRINADGSVVGEIEDASEAAKVFFESLRGYLPQPQTDARVADLLFKLDVAATTFEKVTTSEHREAVFNAEHAKLLRDTIKVLRQPQTDALKIAREALMFYAREANYRTTTMYMSGRSGQTSVEIDGGKRAAEALAALKESK